MKAHRFDLYLLRLPTKLKLRLNAGQTAKDPALKTFGASLKRLFETGDRLRATLGDETDWLDHPRKKPAEASD